MIVRKCSRRAFRLLKLFGLHPYNELVEESLSFPDSKLYGLWTKNLGWRKPCLSLTWLICSWFIFFFKCTGYVCFLKLSPISVSENINSNILYGLVFIIFRVTRFAVDIFSSFSLLIKRKTVARFSMRLVKLEMILNCSKKKSSFSWLQIFFLLQCATLKSTFQFNIIRMISVSCPLVILCSLIFFINSLAAIQNSIVAKEGLLFIEFGGLPCSSETSHDSSNKFSSLHQRKEQLHDKMLLTAEKIQKYLDETVDIVMEAFGSAIVFLLMSCFLYITIELFTLLSNIEKARLTIGVALTIISRSISVWLCVNLGTRLKTEVSGVTNID